MQERVNHAASRPEVPWVPFAENVPWHGATYRPRLDPAWAQDVQSYASSAGVPEFRAAVAGRLRAHCPDASPDHVLGTAGGMHALGLVARDLGARGVRRAWCQMPLFRSVYDSFRAAGIGVGELDLGDPARRAADLGPGDLLYVNTPHNPTGRVLTAEMLERLAHLADLSGCALMIDSVYDDFTVDPAQRGGPTATRLAMTGSAVFKVASMSKNYALPGLRLGWCVSTPENVGRLAVRLEWESVAISTAAQRLGAALVVAPDDELAGTVARGRQRVLAWVGRLADRGLVRGAVGAPTGGTQLWVDLGVADSEDFADYAFAEHAMLLTSHANYVGADPGCLRLPVGLPYEVLDRGLERLEQAITAYGPGRGRGA
jgi:beta-methylarginine biosynthesis bifunctional aminotransferase